MKIKRSRSSRKIYFKRRPREADETVSKYLNSEIGKKKEKRRIKGRENEKGEEEEEERGGRSFLLERVNYLRLISPSSPAPGPGPFIYNDNDKRNDSSRLCAGPAASRGHNVRRRFYEARQEFERRADKSSETLQPRRV